MFCMFPCFDILFCKTLESESKKTTHKTQRSTIRAYNFVAEQSFRQKSRVFFNENLNVYNY